MKEKKISLGFLWNEFKLKIARAHTHQMEFWKSSFPMHMETTSTDVPRDTPSTLMASCTVLV
jgi:hypothetical protein